MCVCKIASNSVANHVHTELARSSKGQDILLFLWFLSVDQHAVVHCSRIYKQKYGDVSTRGVVVSVLMLCTLSTDYNLLSALTFSWYQIFARFFEIEPATGKHARYCSTATPINGIKNEKFYN